jgi:hypothetical protein
LGPLALPSNLSHHITESKNRPETQILFFLEALSNILGFFQGDQMFFSAIKTVQNVAQARTVKFNSTTFK